ncbi:hypothetical protein BSK66_07730 [Paenibacillus odorifer]|uniref:hypothetical protein n=1 Tax=Paenibacillus TaxID=44249 RepID=UPI0003E2C57B|nr:MULTISPECIES: hypothetical protein [Paenibacillus]ETT64892.1 hypothetical protein C171_07747 [Paenibacillus sp. FSL H8-237]OME61011.1 hypothetical protein BSK66_07730 [Paenibacillus odorifer]
MKARVYESDGTEYRVKIREVTWGIQWAEVVVYARRKYFGWRRVAKESFGHGNCFYDAVKPDFIRIARVAVSFYHVPHIIRKGSVDKFREWDGR